MAESKPTFVQGLKYLRTKSYSESSETSIGTDSLSELEMDIAQRDRSGSVNSRDAVVVASTSAGTTPTNSLDNQLYDKYQAR